MPTLETPSPAEQLSVLWLELETIEDDIARHERIADDLTAHGCWRDGLKLRKDIREMEAQRDGIQNAIDELDIEDLPTPEFMEVPDAVLVIENACEERANRLADEDWDRDGDPMQEFVDRRLAAKTAGTYQVVAQPVAM